RLRALDCPRAVRAALPRQRGGGHALRQAEGPRPPLRPVRAGTGAQAERPRLGRALQGACRRGAKVEVGAMAIAFSCKCGKHLKARDEFAGRKIKCPGCQTVLVIPAPAEVSAPATAT